MPRLRNAGAKWRIVEMCQKDAGTVNVSIGGETGQREKSGDAYLTELTLKRAGPKFPPNQPGPLPK